MCFVPRTGTLSILCHLMLLFLEGMDGWLGEWGNVCIPGMAIIYSSHFPQQLLTPVSHLLRPQNRISSATKLI